mmetsp:Transcript_144091/g.268409  ORF Transcript_144091/g.268409 Transcript_144091/m.268409 type:complete len:504 (-) Transcript_144091:170-1681(-)
MGQQPSSSGRHRDGRPRERRSSRDKRREKQQAQAQATALQSVAVGPSVAVPGAFGSVALPGARNVAVGPSIAVPGSIGIPGGQQLNFAVMPGVALGSSVAQIVQAPDFQASGMGFGSSAMGYGSSQASAPSADLLVPGVDFSPEALAATLPPLLPGLAARSNLPGLNTTVAAFPAGYTAPPTAAQLGMPGVSFAMPGSFAAAPLTTTQNLQAVLQPSQTMPALQMQFAADPLMLTMVPTANYVTPTANMVGQQPFATATPAPPVAGTPIPGTGLGSLKGVPLPTPGTQGALPSPMPPIQGMPVAPTMQAAYAPPVVGIPSARPSFVPPAPTSGVLSYPSVLSPGGLSPGGPGSLSVPSYAGSLSLDPGWRQAPSSVSLGQDTLVQERHISREELMAAGNLMTNNPSNSSSMLGASRPGSLNTPKRMFEERGSYGLEPIRASDAELRGYGRAGYVEELQRGPISGYATPSLSASAVPGSPGGDLSRSSGYPPSHPLAPRWVPPS